VSKQIDANRNKRDLRPGSSPLAKRAPDNQAALKKHVRRCCGTRWGMNGASSAASNCKMA